MNIYTLCILINIIFLFKIKQYKEYIQISTCEIGMNNYVQSFHWANISPAIFSRRVLAPSILTVSKASSSKLSGETLRLLREE